jgi:hypothetical protein
MSESRFVINWKPTLLMVAGFLMLFLINSVLNGVAPEFLRLALGLWVMQLIMYHAYEPQTESFARYALHMLIVSLVGGLAVALFKLLWARL